MDRIERADDPYIKISRVNALLRCAICADDTGVDAKSLFGDGDKGIVELLEIAERMTADLQGDIWSMQRKLGEGIGGG